MAGEQETIPPLTWLWQELASRLGAEEAEELHRQYNAHQRRYEVALQARRKQQRHEAEEIFMQRQGTVS